MMKRILKARNVLLTHAGDANQTLVFEWKEDEQHDTRLLIERAGEDLVNINLSQGEAAGNGETTLQWKVARDKSHILHSLYVMKKYDVIQNKSSSASHSIVIALSPFGCVLGVFELNQKCSSFSHNAKEISDGNARLFVVKGKKGQIIATLNAQDQQNIHIAFKQAANVDVQLVMSMAIILTDRDKKETIFNLKCTHGQKTFIILCVFILLLSICIVCFTTSEWTY